MSASTITTHHWIARDPASVEILRTVDKVKDTPSTLLIQGESGTGKDLLASLIHYSSLRCDEPFLRIDCSSIPTELLESELFGYEKGAFTGAYARKLGKLEFAGKGTIVLDEITALSIETQAKLLRVIEDRTFGRLGGNRVHPCRRTFGGAFERTAWRPREKRNISGRLVLPLECHPNSTAALARTDGRHHPTGGTFLAARSAKSTASPKSRWTVASSTNSRLTHSRAM